jgi:hypothetical protein
MRILSVDPGNTTGWAEIVDGKVTTFGVEKGDEIWAWLSRVYHSTYDAIVVEDFRIRPGVNFSWSQLFPIQVIGALRFIATVQSMNFVLQSPSIKPAAYARAGLKYERGKPNKHIEDAVAHGIFYWEKHGQAKVQ